jgi:hypothetical protein
MSLADIEEEENDIDGKFVTSPNDSLAHVPEGRVKGTVIKMSTALVTQRESV